MTLLTCCREVTPHPEEDPRPFLRPEAARDFLPRLHHLQVRLRPIVSKGHREVSHEAQYLVAAAEEPVDVPPLPCRRRALPLRRIAPVCLGRRAPVKLINHVEHFESDNPTQSR